MENFEHISVLAKELVDSLDLQIGDVAIDCTAGGGGHTAAILELVGSEGKVLAFDRDPWAISTLQKRFAQSITAGTLEVIPARFSSIVKEVQSRGLLHKVKGICADIGVSSPQLDFGERGFSFNKEGPLDMRMDPTQGVSAEDVINEYSEDALIKIFREYGEEPQSRQIVRSILRQRSQTRIKTTTELATLVASSVRYKERSRKHPATKIFQALRIVVNQEIDELNALLHSIPDVLMLKGRCSVISFHSLEDRLVKQEFRKLAEGDRPKIDRRLPLTSSQLEILENRQFSIIKPFPQSPSDEELEKNPRSRSAKLRVIERIKLGGEI